MLITERIYIPEDAELSTMLGVNQENLQLLRTLFPKLRIVAAHNILKILGEGTTIDQFICLLDAIALHASKYNYVNEEAIRRLVRGDAMDTPEPKFHILYGAKGRSVAAKGVHQEEMVKAFEEKDMIFALGPAGTGKTFIAIALAVKALKEKKVRKIILSRPAVEAGEKLGFLPGEMKDKLDPYLQPLYDALEEMIPAAKLKDYMELGVIQIAPLAYMRGRTLNDAVVILDEAQNTSVLQMKMFLTRMGYYSKMIITGDISQIDLPYGARSGLKDAQEVLKGVTSIAQITFDKKDIVRHPLVQKIVDAYEQKEQEKKLEKKIEK